MTAQAFPAAPWLLCVSPVKRTWGPPWRPLVLSKPQTLPIPLVLRELPRCFMEKRAGIPWASPSTSSLCRSRHSKICPFFLLSPPVSWRRWGKWSSGKLNILITQGSQLTPSPPDPGLPHSCRQVTALVKPSPQGGQQILSMDWAFIRAERGTFSPFALFWGTYF